MPNTPDTPASTKRRRSQVYVDIPLANRNSTGHSFSPQATKENSPLKPSKTNTEFDMTVVKSLKTSATKRKRDDVDEDHTQEEAPPKSKKAKLTDHGKHERKQKGSDSSKTKKPDVKESRATPEAFPNGSFYCHQCGKKRDKSLSIQCTIQHESAKGRLNRCTTKYCKACLHNRYSEDIDDLKSNNGQSRSPLSKREKEKHVDDESYFFECFKCRDVCNCPSCQKSRGDEPLGNLAVKARQAKKVAAAQGEIEKQGESSSKAKKAKGSKASLVPAEGTGAAGKSSKPRAKPKAKALPKPKPMPKPIWTLVGTPLPLADAESRVGIREFVQRFSGVLQVANGHLEELDEVSGDSLGITEDWEDGDDENVEVYSWVSELCAKAIILGLVEVLVAHAESKNAHAEAAAAKEAAKAIRSSGANLNRVWAALVKLRESNPVLDLRSPLPPPTTAVFRHTRSGMQNGTDTVHIGCSAQVIPVIEDLIETVIETSPIREAIEAGFMQEKEFTKEVKEAITKENANWKARKESKDKASREQHNRILRDLEYCGQLVATHYFPRFAPLGRDNDGRVYYAMNPGAGEFEAALQLVRGKDRKVKIGRRRGPWTEDDRRDLQRWSWFIAVWGRKPEGAKVDKRGDDDEDDEDTWWGFWQPEEILTLAEWISRKANLGEEPKGKGNSIHSNGDSQRSTCTRKGVTKASGSYGRTVSATSSLTSLSSSRSARELSPLSVLSSDDEGEEDDDSDAEMADESNTQGPPNVQELRGLVRGLKDYSEMLQWRIGRVTRDAREDSEGPATIS